MSRQKRAAEAALFLPLLLAIGCGPVSEATNQGPGQTEPSCVPNQTLTCACPDGSQGARVCTQAGVLTDCQCNSMLAYNAGSGSVAPVVTPTVNDQPGDDTAPAPVPEEEAVPAPEPPAPVEETTPGPPVEETAPADTTEPPPADTTAPVDPVDTTTATACLLPNSVPNVTMTDVNPLSPTYNQARNLDDVCNKVIVIYYTMFH
jgi:hypothetical protein